MLRNVTYGFMLMSAVLLMSHAALADDAPTIDQVYQSAHVGKLDEAQGMMDKVLKAHPNSAKAHFVDAELLAKQDKISQAADELKTAEHLQPGLSFANPQAVQDLKHRIAATPHYLAQSTASNNQPASANSFPWGMLLLGVGAIAVIVLVMRAMNSRNTNTYPGSYQSGMQNTSGSPPMQPYGGGMSPMGSAGGGIGSGIMGGLATGAAVGVGMVAGEALAHHFMDGGHSAQDNVVPVADSWTGSQPDNMGGQDFGIADNSSWSDNSSVADNSSDVSGGDWG